MYECTQVCMNTSMLEFTFACRCMVASLRCMRGIPTNVLVHLPFRTLVRFTLRTLVGPPRSPLTSTCAKHEVPPPSQLRTHRNALSVSPHSTLILHSAFLQSSLRKFCCTPYLFAHLDLRHLSPFLTTDPAQHIHEVRGEQRPLLDVKPSDAMKQTVSLSVQDACKMCSQPQSRFKSRGTRSHMTGFNLYVNSIPQKKYKNFWEAQ